MTIDERIANITTGMEAMKARQDSFNDGVDRLKASIEATKAGIEATRASIEAMKDRHDALTMNLELMGHELRDIKIASQQDGENIRALARIAEIHERRITDMEN